MRLFIAVNVPDEVRAAAETVASELRRQMPDGTGVRWVRGENLHLTVRFIGHVANERAAAVLKVLEPPLARGSFDVELGGCGVFPKSGPPRVVWIGLATGLPSLRAMHDEFDRRLAPLGFMPEAREFSVHLTLARIKDVSGGAAATLRRQVATLRPPAARWSVSAATLYESLLSPKGPTYRPLFDIPC